MSAGKLSPIALLSDFGLEDSYVGIMKGVIAAINPEVRVIDLTHRIRPQDIRGGSFSLQQAYPYFPKGTIYLAVVDPGVGSQRRAIAIAVERGYLVGPDNGLFTGILAQTKVIAAVELTTVQYWGKASPSPSFHGRDIFAPVAAHLSRGVTLAALGSNLKREQLVCLPNLTYEITPTGVVGEVEYIDHFGNLITNIPATAITSNNWTVVINNAQIPGVQTYSDVPFGEVLALIGSQEKVEISINGGNAKSQLNLNRGALVKLVNSKLKSG